MLCGGTGIAPMYQALVKMLADPADASVVTLLYGNKSPEDILLRKELDALAAKHPSRLKLTHVIGAAADAKPPEGWDGEVGWIDAARPGSWDLLGAPADISPARARAVSH